MKKILLSKCFALFASNSNKKNTSRFNGILALFIMGMGMGVSWGQVATWSQTWSGTGVSPLASSSVGTNVASASMARVNLTGGSSSSRYSSSVWNSTSNYLTITVTANIGYVLNLNSQTFTASLGSSGTGPQGYNLYSSVDNYASSLGSFTKDCSGQTQTIITLPVTGYNGLSSITFRIVGVQTGCSSTLASGGTGGPSAIVVGGAAILSVSTTNFYSKSTGNLNDVANWGTATDGTGTAPSDFTSANQVFNIRNNATPTIGAAWTVSGSGSKIIVGDGSAACNFTIPALYAVTGTVDVSAGATLTNTNTANPTLGTLNATSTVVFNAAGAQTVPLATYGNLSISNAGSSTATAAGAITVTTALTVSSGSTFDMVTYALSGAALTTSGTGTLKTQSTSATPLPTGRTWSMDVLYNSASGQTVVAGTHTNLNISGGNRTLIASGTINISGTYTPGSGTLTVTSNTINFNGADGQTIPAATYNNLTSSNNTRTLANGDIKIASTFTPGSSNYTIGTSTVEFNGSAAQTIPVLPVASGGNYYNLTYSGNSIGTLGGSITVAGNFVQSAGNFQITSTSSASAVTLNVTGNVTLSNAALKLLNSTINGASATLNVTGNTTTSGSTSIFFETVNNSNASGIAIFQTNDFTTTSIVSNIIDFGISTVLGNEFRISGNFSKSGNGKFLTSSSSASTGFVFNKSGTQTFSYSGANSSNTQYVVNSGSTLQLLTSLTMGAFTNPTSTFTVNGTLDMGINVISGTTNPTFTLGATGAIITSNTGGLVTAITTPGTNVFTAGASYTFNGATTTPFHSATLGAPANVIINANVTLNKSTTITNSLSLTSGNLTIGANTLTLNGAVVNTSGTITGSSTSNLTIGGTAGTLNFTSGSRALNNLSLGASGVATLGSALDVYGVLGFTAGGSLNMNAQAVTLKSTATATARVNDLTGSTLSGASNVTVERYIPAKRAWRALTAPVIGSTNNSIFYNWQNNGVPSTGTGVELWSSTGGNGMGTGPSNSILTYNNAGTTGAWNPVTNTNTKNLFESNINNAFMVFVTGPYATSSTNISAGSAITTLKATGQLITGTQTYENLPSGVHTLIGNPYACPISPLLLLNGNTSFGANLWVWDANTTVNNGVGAYNTYDKTTNKYTNITNSAQLATTPDIQSGQAFFVKASTGTATLSISESYKSTGTSTYSFLRTSSPPELLRVGLYKQVNNEWSGRDGAMTVILSDAVANQASNKMANGSENVAFTKNGASFASNHHLPLVASDVLNVKVWNTTAGANYKLKINTEEFSATNLSATLEDLFTNARTPLTLDGSAVEYPFTVTTEALSTGDRFRIVFQPSLLGNNIPKSNGFSIVPNPVTGDSFQVNLGSLATGTYSYSICNTIGQEVEKGSINNATQNTNYEVKMNNPATGIYIMKIKGNNNSVFTAKIIKK